MISTVNNARDTERVRTEFVACDLCGACDYKVLFEGRDRLHQLPGIFPLVQCRRCQFVYLNPRPTKDTLADYYPDDYSPFQRGEGFTQSVQSWLRLKQACLIKKTIPLGGRVLEVGCATGDLLVPLKKLGLSVAGIEISPHAAEVAQREHALEVHVGTLWDAPFTLNSFDAVVMRHVIEHLPSAALSIKQIAHLLKPGGFLFITTPNYDSFDRIIFGEFWHNYDIPRHQMIFSVDTLTMLLQKADFQLLHVKHSLLPNEWILSLRHLFAERFKNKFIVNFFSLRNPIALIMLLPFGVLQKLLKKSGRVDVVARKRL